MRFEKFGQGRGLRLLLTSSLLVVLIGVIALGPSLAGRLAPAGSQGLPYAAEPGEEDEGEMLLSMGDYFFHRVSYPTGNFNSAWLLEAAAAHEPEMRHYGDCGV